MCRQYHRRPNEGREGGGKKLRRPGVLARLAVLLPERWLSGLRRTPGKREYLNSTVGSNPSLSASLNLTAVGSGLFFPHGPRTWFFENGQ